MNKVGHWGAALLFAAPPALGLAAATGDAPAAVPFAALAVLFARLPDIDQRLPIVSHRGVTHTLAFVFLSTSLVGFATSFALQHRPVDALPYPPDLSMLYITGSFFVGLLSHLAADMLTKGYDYTIKPLWPIDDRTVQLGLASSSSYSWNVGLLLCGGLAYTPLYLF